MEDIPKEILINASKGDLEAFETIYQAFCQFVYTLALRIMNNEDEARDVTQDVFIKIYKNLNRFHFRSSFKTWVYRISVNTALTACKEKKKEMERRIDDDHILMEQIDTSMMEAASKDDNDKLVAYLLKKLNPDQRACLVLREMEGLDYKQIADSVDLLRF